MARDCRSSVGLAPHHLQRGGVEAVLRFAVLEYALWGWVCGFLLFFVFFPIFVCRLVC